MIYFGDETNSLGHNQMSFDFAGRSHGDIKKLNEFFLRVP